jgi:hypothetical protein
MIGKARKLYRKCWILIQKVIWLKTKLAIQSVDREHIIVRDLFLSIGPKGTLAPVIFNVGNKVLKRYFIFSEVDP